MLETSELKVVRRMVDAGMAPDSRRMLVWTGQLLVLLAALAFCQPTFTSQHLAGAAIAEATDGETPITKVLASDIGKRVQIIGLLGHPLGKLVTLRGSWTFPRELEKDGQPTFAVTSVNGKKLNNPVKFRNSDFHCVVGGLDDEIPQREGDTWEVRGCESGRFFGAPGDVLGDVSEGGKPLPPIQQARRFGFYTYFMYSSYKPVSNASSK